MPETGTPWMEEFHLPPLSSGRLDGLRFGVKDFIGVEGKVTGCGNPDWRKDHAPAAAHAVCVRLLLEQGARCLGKTISDEFAYSLVGENHFYGTPLNPAAPDHVPGGSSSGSASAVAAGLVDFALGTDTAGSVRVPASNCGIFGYRPSHGAISLAGVQALAPSFDTVGLLARTAEVLERAAQSLLADGGGESTEIKRVYILEDAWELADDDAGTRRESMLEALDQSGVEWVSLRLKDALPENGFGGLMDWKNIFSEMQPAENWETFGGWLESACPQLGPRIRENFRIAREIHGRITPEKLERRERAGLLLRRFLQPGMALGLPTTPVGPPLKGKVDYDRASGTYLPRVLALTTLSGIAGLPQISLPLGPKAGAPVGFSVIGSRNEDGALLRLARRIAEE